jgi:hypothetical protein
LNTNNGHRCGTIDMFFVTGRHISLLPMADKMGLPFILKLVMIQ